MKKERLSLADIPSLWMIVALCGVPYSIALIYLSMQMAREAWITEVVPRLSYYEMLGTIKLEGQLPAERESVIEFINWSNSVSSEYSECQRALVAHNPAWASENPNFCNSSRSEWYLRLGHTLTRREAYEHNTSRWNTFLASSLQIAASDPRVREYYFAHEHKTDGLPALVGG